jgi:Protein kinase domain
MIHSGSSFFDSSSIQSVSQSSLGVPKGGPLSEVSSVTAPSLFSQSSLNSLRLSPLTKFHYRLIGVFSVSRAQKLAESEIEGMVLARKAELLSSNKLGVVKTDTENLRKEIEVLSQTFKKEHPLGRAVPWMVEDAIANAFSKEAGITQLIQKIEEVGHRYQARLASYAENKREQKTEAAINRIYKHFVSRTITGRENPELVKDVLLNYFKPEKAEEYIIDLLRGELQNIKAAHSQTVFSRQEAESFVESYCKDPSSYLVITHKAAVMDMVLRELNVPKYELNEAINHLSIPSHSLFAMKEISRLVGDLNLLENEKDQEELLQLLMQKLAPFKRSILEKLSYEIMTRSLSEKNQVLRNELKLHFYPNIDALVKSAAGEIKQEFLQEGIDCSHPLFKKLFSIDFDNYIYNHAIFALFPAQRLDYMKKNVYRIMDAGGWNHAAALSPLSLAGTIDAICLHYPQRDHVFVSEIVRYHADPEKSRLNFIKSCIKEFKDELNRSSDMSIENRENIVKKLKEKFAWHPTFKDFPFLKFVLFDQVFFLGKAYRLDKKMYGLKDTLIFCEGSSDAYILKNKLSDVDMNTLRLQFPGAEISRSADGKCVLGQGYFGKVRFAKNLVTGCFVAVKKIRSQADAKEEVQKFNLVGKGKYLIPLYNVAELSGKDRAQKTYLLMEYVNGFDGVDFLNKPTDHWSIAEKNKKLKSVAAHYLRSVAELHQKGIYHRDVKPDNFMHARNGDIRLIDYGFCSNKNYQQGGATIRYASPEWLAQSRNYTGEKHDSFSLGVSLLYLNSKLGAIDKLIQLTDASGKTHAVLTNVLPQFGLEAVFLGFEGVSRLKGETLDEVIMLLMAKNPRERITPKRALALPFFKNL